MTTEIWVALIGALSGTTLVKIVEHFMNKGKIRDDAAAQFRKELRDEVQALKNELVRVDHEVDSWKQKYYELLGQFIQVKGELEAALRQIKQYANQNVDIADQAAKNLQRNIDKD